MQKMYSKKYRYCTGKKTPGEPGHTPERLWVRWWFGMVWDGCEVRLCDPCARVSRVNVNTTDATTGATALLLPVCVACVSRGEDVSTPAPVLDPLPSAEDRPVSL